MDVSSQQFATDLVAAVDQSQAAKVSVSMPKTVGFDSVKSEIFDSMKVFETMGGNSVDALELGGGTGDFRTTSLELARFRADMYKIETVATAAQNVIGTFKNFVSTFTK
jgi:hypothetical protein